MLPCHNGCAYKENIPGNTHIGCCFDWTGSTDEVRKGYPRCSNPSYAQQWFIFPYNFDPCWGPDNCTAFSTERDEKMIKKQNSFEQLIALLGKRMF